MGADFMGKFKDLTGQKFGKLTVVVICENSTSFSKFHCKCDCGNELDVFAGNLIRGHTKSCGCIPSRLPEDLTGKKFGKLTVIELLPKNGKDRKWKCKCDCGNDTEVVHNKLKSGHTKSCGCFKKDWVIKNKIHNLMGLRFGKLVVIDKKESINNKARWEVLCDCGNKCVVYGANLVKGATQSCGCLNSKMEMTCKDILSKYEIDFVPQKTFSNCIYKGLLRFDIYIPLLNFCIETDGVQHDYPIDFFGGQKNFEQQKIRDSIKDKYCLDNNISLLRIPYTQFDNLEQILIENNIIKGETNGKTALS